MKKMNLKLLRTIFFIAIVIVLVIIMTYSYYFGNQYLTTGTNDNASDILGFHAVDSNIKINQKTPRNLFAKYLRASLLSWCGYYRAFTSGVECVSPSAPNDKDFSNLQNKWKNKLLPLSYALIGTSFSLNDIHSAVSGDKYNVTLGNDENRQTFTLQKTKKITGILLKKTLKIRKLSKNSKKSIHIKANYNMVQWPNQLHSVLMHFFFWAASKNLDLLIKRH